MAEPVEQSALSADQELRHRDGTSRAGRTAEALDPQYIPIDERSFQDLLAFTREYAKELRFLSVQNGAVRDTDTDTWSAFLDQGIDLDAVAAFMENPAAFSGEQAQDFQRPHFVLLLTFLKLLRHAQNQLNTLTDRHLEYYYRDVLRMNRQPAVPGQVHVLVDLAQHTEEFLLPAGTPLYAGTDSLGQGLLYRTDTDTLISRAQVGRLYSLFVEQRITGIPEARKEYKEDNKKAFLYMLHIALGAPQPGDQLPLYPLEPDSSGTDLARSGTKVDYDFLITLYNLVLFTPDRLHMDFSELRILMQLKQQLDQSDSASNTINAFERNFEAALGDDPFESESLKKIDNLDDYYKALLDIEAYFFLAPNRSAEQFTYMMSVAEKDKASAAEWQKVYAILADAHKRKISADRQKILRQLRENNKSESDQGLGAMINFAVGEAGASADQEPLQRLLEYLNLPDDVLKVAELSIQLQNAQSKNETLTEAQWNEVYKLAEKAWRVYSNQPEPVARKIEWQNLYAAHDAAAVRAESATAGTEQLPWKTFGKGQPLVQQNDIPETVFGWCISSPVLALSEGKRTITLALGFEPNEGVPDALMKEGESPFLLQVSTEKDWLEPIVESVEVLSSYQDAVHPSPDPGAAPDIEEEKLSALRFTLSLDSSADALTAPQAAAPGEISSPWPVLRLTLRQIWQSDEQPDGQHGGNGRYVTRYKEFKELLLRKVHLKVDVNGLLPSQLQNDEGVLKPKKPFEPFGMHPSAGARLYIGHPELIWKKLDTLKFNVEWMGKPDDLVAHYKNYTIKIPSEDDFTARISLIDKHADFELTKAAALFSDGSPLRPSEILEILGDKYEREPEAVTGDDLFNWNRYLQWELNAPDFQHDAYPALAVQKSVALAVAISNGSIDEDKSKSYQVNPPYTPKLKTLTLDYSSSIEIDLAEYETGGQPDQIIHIQPFGYAEVQPKPETDHCSFLPQFDLEGQLYIGIQDAKPPQDLSLLFQLIEGSADPDLEPQPVSWDYLSGNRWISLNEGKVLADGTRGLINSGIITFRLEPTEPSTLLPPDCYWLRVSIPMYTGSVCDSLAIHAQAVSATFADQGNTLDHLSSSLAAESISEPAEGIPEILALRQPYTSFNGKMPEQAGSFRTRVSERLRHKNRALTVWDYEHILLEQFPQLYKVKCLPAKPEKPGQVHLILIPDVRKQLPFTPFEPKVSADLLADVRAFLADKMPPAADLKIGNARYIAVKTRFAVRFLPGYNTGYCRQQLNEELCRFLSPWAYEEGADIIIGGSIYANTIINFIEERPYVDYLAQVKLFTSEDGKTFSPAPHAESGEYWVEAAGPDCVLASAKQHEIDIIPDTGYTEESYIGINYMKIGLDFIVATTKDAAAVAA